jgi:hypothetical protein
MDTVIVAALKRLESRIREVDLRQGGPRGPKGRKGDAGPVGSQGSTGPEGSRGTQGSKGQAGPTGKVGVDGTSGPQGPRGFSGSDGNAGLHGSHGRDGTDGVSIVDAQVDLDGHLTISLSDGTEIDAGLITADGDGQITYVAGSSGKNYDKQIEDLQDQIDQIVADLNAHLGDFNNPHQVMHDQLTDVTPDQHHPQLHDLDSHTDVQILNGQTGQSLIILADGMTWGNKTSDTETWPTGLANGGELNIGPGPNDIELIAGVGLIMDNYTDPLSPPVAQGIQWPQINEPITALPAVAGSVVFFTAYDTGVSAAPIGNFPVNVGGLHQWAQRPSPTLARQEIPLGFAIHDGVVWQEVSNPKVINQTAETLREVATDVLPFSTITEGGTVTEQPAFMLDQEEGVIWENNRNWHVDKSDPNREVLPAKTPTVFEYVNRDFTDVGLSTSTVDPTMWDNNGVVEPVGGGPSGETTIQRLYLDPGDNYWILWGQTVYPTFFTAQANLLGDVVVVPSLLQSSILLGYIISEKGKTDWDVNEAIFTASGSGAGAGGGGTPITDHDNLNGITPDNHHRQLHPLVGLDLDGFNQMQDVNPAVAPVLRDLLAFDGSLFQMDRRTRSVGDYVQAVVYNNGDELFNGSDLSEARIDGVTSFPYVSPTGDQFNIFQGTMSDFAQLAKQIIFGNRYQSTEGFYITGYRVETVVGNEYSVYVINDPTGPTPVGELILTFTAEAAGWQSFNLEARAVAPNSLFDIIAIVNEPDPTPVEVIASYNYLTPQNVTDPLLGQITQSRGQSDLMQVSYTDNDAIDRTALIQGLTPGDQIVINLISYAIQSNQVDAGFANIVVAPAVTTLAGIQDITFETVVATPISVAEDLNYWPTSNFPLVQGLKAVDTPYADIIPDDNAYGVDLLVQAAYVPDPAEWWLKIVAGTGGGGGGDFVPAIFTGAGTTGYVPDPVTENEQFLRDDGTWQDAGGGATESKINQVAHGFAVMDAVRFTGVAWVKAQANDINTTALGLVVEVTDVDNFVFAMSGRYQIGSLTADQWYYLDDAVAGGLVATEPGISQPMVYAEDGSWILIYPYRPSYAVPSTNPMVGEMRPFYGDPNDILPLWHLCDGTNGTPDLRGRTIYGAGNGYIEGASGGIQAVDRDVTDAGGHTHTFSGNTLGSHNHGSTGKTSHAHSVPGNNRTVDFGTGFTFRAQTTDGNTTQESQHVHGTNSTSGGTPSGTNSTQADHTHALTDDDPLHFVVTGFIMFTGVA